jgi:murein DD-endopeptidase MepM/ murein hydrolase activator NlpD
VENTVSILLLQIALPVLLLIWLHLFPARRVWPWLLQVLAVAASLIGLAYVGVWLFPPWWTLYAYLVTFCLIVAWHGMHLHQTKRAQPATHWLAKLIFLAALGLGAYGSSLVFAAFAGRRFPAGIEVVDIAAPAPAGTYLVAQGGSDKAINAHLKTLDMRIERFKNWRGQSYAVDIVRINRLGLRGSGYQPPDPAYYFTYGVPLLAPCSGPVVAAQDGMPDLKVPEMDTSNLLGNHIILDCSGRAIVMAHLRNGSVGVKIGEIVATGGKIAEFGNSGNSAEPHLHIHAQRTVPPVHPISGEPLALTINGRYLVRNNRMEISEK